MTRNLETAKQLLAEAKGKSRDWSSRALLRRAIAILEAVAPDSEELADAYLSLCMVHAFVKCRPVNRAAHRQLAASSYEKAIEVWERNGNNESLAGNLCNLGSLYYRFGDFETSLARNLRALDLARVHRCFKDDEGVAFWNHVAGSYLALGRLDEAEAIVVDGLKVLGDSTPNSSYLWSTRAKIFSAKAAASFKAYTAHAAAFHKRAEELAPPDSCAI